jgi:hypothetical protein
MHARLILTTAAAALALAAPCPASAGDGAVPRVGIVLELTVGVEPMRADALGAALADALNRELMVDAFGGADVARRLPGGGLPEECLANAACVADVATRIDADQILFLALVQVGDDVQVDASWIDVATRRVKARPRVVLVSDAEAVSVFADHAQRFLPDAAPRAAAVVIHDPGRSRTVAATPRRMTVPAWVGAGVSVVAAGAGTALGLSARARYERCEDRRTCSDAELDGIDRRALVTDVAFAVAAAAAITTVVLYLRSGTPAREVALVGVAPTPGGAVIGVGGRLW